MKSKTVQIVVAIVLIAAAFWAGTAYEKHAAASSATASRGSYAGFGTGTGAAGASGTRSFAGRSGAGGASGGAGIGQIVSVGSGSISIQFTGAASTTGSQVVLYSPATTITKTVSGTASDLQVGDSVVVEGTSNSDGSMTAASIQVRQESQSQ